jgi:hypothetical protein
MKLKIFLLTFSLLIPLAAKAQNTNFSVIWGDIQRTDSQFHNEFQSEKSENFYISYESKKLELNFDNENLYLNFKIRSLRKLNRP